MAPAAAKTCPRTPEVIALPCDAQKRVRIWRRGRNHHVALAAEPQNCGGDKHEHTGNAKSKRGPEIPQENRHEKRGEERSEVNDPVEGIEHDLGAMFVCLVELIANECCHARFDPARPERNQTEPDIKAGAIGDEHRETSLAQAVNQTQPENGVVFPEETISQPATEKREKINADDESVKDILGRDCALAFRQIGEQRRNEKDSQDVAHPVEAEPLATFVADDVADLPRNRRFRIRDDGNVCRQDFLHARLFSGRRTFEPACSDLFREAIVEAIE